MNSRLAWVTDILCQIKPIDQRKETKEKTLKSVRPRLCVIAKSSSSIFMFVCGVTICMVCTYGGTHVFVCNSECTCVCLWRPKVDKSSIILLRYSLTRVGLSVKFRIHPYVCSMTPLSLPMDARI